MVEEEITQLKALHLLLTEDEQEVLLEAIAVYAHSLNTSPLTLGERSHRASAGKSLLLKIGQQLIEQPQEK